MTIVILYFPLKKYIEMHKEGYNMNFINLVLDKVYSQSPNMKEIIVDRKIKEFWMKLMASQL